MYLQVVLVIGLISLFYVAVVCLTYAPMVLHANKHLLAALGALLLCIVYTAVVSALPRSHPGPGMTTSTSLLQLMLSRQQAHVMQMHAWSFGTATCDLLARLVLTGVLVVWRGAVWWCGVAGGHDCVELHGCGAHGPRPRPAGLAQLCGRAGET